MKKLALVVLSLFFISGCIDYTSTVKLNPDGSGTIEETVLLSASIIQMMNSFSQSFADSSTESDKFNLFDEAELRNQALEMGDGVEYLRGEELKMSGMEGYKAIYSFSDISKVKLSESPDDKISMDEMQPEGEAVSEPEYVTFSFEKGNPASLEIMFPEDKNNDQTEVDINQDGGENEENQDMMEQQMKMFLKDFKISMNLEVAGSISNTNATFVDKNKITLLELSFNEILDNPDMMKKLTGQEPNSMGELKELIKNIPGFKVEMNKKVFVKFDK